MLTNLIGQYVVNGWGEDAQYQEIVAVSVDRDKMSIWARNPDDNLVLYDGDGCRVVKRAPGQKRPGLL